MKITVDYSRIRVISHFMLTIIFLVTFNQINIVYAAQSELDKNQTEEEMFQRLTNIIQASQIGPIKIPLADQAILNLPNGYCFIPPKEAADLNKLIGNSFDPNLMGMIISDDLEFKWHIAITFSKVGYIREDEAKDLNADELLNIIKENTAKSNEERVKKGFSPLEVQGWIESPIYNSSKHQLIYSILADNKSSEKTVNYNSDVLGREGYINFNLVTSNSLVLENKIHIHKTIASVDYNEGKRYENFVESTDHVAKYGLAALITGVVAKKAGLLAVIGIFAVKMWKLLILIPVALFAGIKGLFNRNSKNASDSDR